MWSNGPNIFILSWSGDKVVQLSLLVDWKDFPWVDDNHQWFEKEGKNPVCLYKPIYQGKRIICWFPQWALHVRAHTDRIISLKHAKAICHCRPFSQAPGCFRDDEDNELKFEIWSLSLSLQRHQLFQSIPILLYVYIYICVCVFISVTVVKPSHPILNYAVLSLAELQIIALSCNILPRNDRKLLKLWYITMENPVVIIIIIIIIISITIAWRYARDTSPIHPINELILKTDIRVQSI